MGGSIAEEKRFTPSHTHLTHADMGVKYPSMKLECSEAADDMLGIVVLKPRFFSTPEKTPTQSYLEKRLADCKLEVLTTACVCLSTQDIHDLYPDIFDTSLVTSERLEELREALLMYMADHVFAYLVFGDNVLEHLMKIKEEIRTSIGYIKGSLDVQNGVHVPERSQLQRDIALFFKTALLESPR